MRITLITQDMMFTLTATSIITMEIITLIITLITLSNVNYLLSGGHHTPATGMI